jgi:hypothetical protein
MMKAIFAGAGTTEVRSMNAPPVANDRQDPARPADRSAVADYLATMAANLAKLAQANQLSALGYILEMAAMEAASVAGREAAGRNPDEDPG